MLKINITKSMHLGSSERLVLKVLDHPIYMIDELSYSHMLPNAFLRDKAHFKFLLLVDVTVRDKIKNLFQLKNFLKY